MCVELPASYSRIVPKEQPKWKKNHFPQNLKRISAFYHACTIGSKSVRWFSTQNFKNSGTEANFVGRKELESNDNARCLRTFTQDTAILEKQLEGPKKRAENMQGTK